MKCFVVGFAAVTMAGFTGFADEAETKPFDAETMAFYRFVDDAPGAVVKKVTNAVDSALFVGTAGKSNTGTLPKDVTVLDPIFSDDVPGQYLYDGAFASEPYVASYGSVVFQDNFGTDYPGCDAAVTNENGYISPGNRPTGTSQEARPWGNNTITLAGLNEAVNALGGDGDWTIEFFMKNETMYNTQCPFNMTKEKAGTENGVYIIVPRNSDGSTQLFGPGGAKSEQYNVNWNGANRDTNIRFGDGLWRHVALRHRGGAENTVSLLFNYRSSGGSIAYANRADGIADMILGDYRAWPGNPFYGKIAAFRVTKRYLEVSELLYASDMARSSAEGTLLHVSFDELAAGAAVEWVQGHSAHPNAAQAMARVGIDANSKKMVASDELPKKKQVWEGRTKLLSEENLGSVRTFLPNGEGTETNDAYCSYRWSPTVDATNRMATAGFTVELFFRASMIWVDAADRGEGQLLHLSTVGNGNGILLGYNKTGDSLYSWWPQIKEDGSVQDRASATVC